MIRKAIFLLLILSSHASNVHARDFEDGYAVYGAGAEPCSSYLTAMQKGGLELEFFIDWLIGYFSAFNVIMPNTYNILGETSFPAAQGWLERHCKRYPNELFVNATARLTEVLYPTRYQSELKEAPAKPPVEKPKSRLGDVSKFVK